MGRRSLEVKVILILNLRVFVEFSDTHPFPRLKYNRIIKLKHEVQLHYPYMWIVIYGYGVDGEPPLYYPDHSCSFQRKMFMKRPEIEFKYHAL